MANLLSGEVVVITGGSTGIGRAIALAAAREGADVAITYRANVAGAHQVEADIVALGRRAMALKLDVSDDPQVGRCGAAIVDRFGRFDTWINNAGADILTGDAAQRSTLDRLDRLLAVDLRGTMVASWYAVEVLSQHARGGVVINMSWDHAITGMPGRNPELFAAAKGGVLAFSKALARSAAPRVRVNVLAPGWIETAFGSALEPSRYDAVRASIPLGRWGTPDDVAHAAVFLASPGASYITGQTLMVGGGVVTT